MISFAGKGILRILAAIGLLVVLVTFTPLVSWWAKLYAGAWNDPAGDVLIVLAGDQLDDGIIGRSSYWRCVYAAMAWKAGGFRGILISGVRSAPLMADLMVFNGVPRDAIRLEPRSSSTRENALFTAGLLRQIPGTKVLLTSDFHMLRAHRAFAKAGVEVLPRPFPDALKRSQHWHNRLEVFFDLVLETLKIVWYAAHNWI